MRSIFGWASRKADSAPEPAPQPAAEAANAWSTLRATPPIPPRMPDPAPAPVAAPPPVKPSDPAVVVIAPKPVPSRTLLPAARRRPWPLARTGNLQHRSPQPVAYAGPNIVERFVETSDLDELGTLPVPHRLRLHPAMRSAAPAPLFDEEALPPRIRALHAARPDAPAIDMIGLPGYELGGAGLLQQDGRVFVDSGILPGYICQSVRAEGLELPQMWRGSLVAPDAEIVVTDQPVALAFHPNVVYGHFLLEMLPRLHVLAKLRAYGRAFPIAVPMDWPKWVHDFVALFYGPSEIIWYNKERQRVRAPCFVVPTMMHVNYNFHPELNTAARDVLDRALHPLAAPTPPRVYLSRSRHAPGRHGIRNELEVENTLSDLGFAVVHPQELSFSAQMSLYDGAECIVSEYGSATHNSLFASRGTAVFCINWLNECQSRICALRGQPLGFLSPEGGFYDPDSPPENDGFFHHADCRELAQRVTAFECAVREMKDGAGETKFR
jgi:capsular polysaccharide biosynthesis protein